MHAIAIRTEPPVWHFNVQLITVNTSFESTTPFSIDMNLTTRIQNPKPGSGLQFYLYLICQRFGPEFEIEQGISCIVKDLDCTELDY